MSVSFDTRPVRRSRGPDRSALIAIALASFVVLAVVKPWQGEQADAVGPTAVPSPSAVARQSAAPRNAGADPTPFDPTADSIASALVRGGRGLFFLDSAGEATIIPARAVRQLDRVRALLAPDGSTAGTGPRIAAVTDLTPSVLGVTLPRGAVVQAASLWHTAPAVRPVDAVRHVVRAAAARPGDAGLMPEVTIRRRGFVAFSTPDGSPWPAGAYRITVRYWDPDYRLEEWSWHLDLGVSRPDPPLVFSARPAMLVP